jgi:hypothetical protein
VMICSSVMWPDMMDTRSENPRVGGSIPPLGTTHFSSKTTP